MKTAVSVSACWLAVLVCASAQQPPPAQTPTFRTGVDAVQLDVSVLDKERRPVRGLTAADFTVLDDGKPRQIVAFSAVELPALPAPVCRRSSRRRTRSARMSPATICPTDASSSSSSIRSSSASWCPDAAASPTRRASRRCARPRRAVVDSLGPGDVAAVAHTFYGVPQNFTTDKARLKRAIDTRPSARNSGRGPGRGGLQLRHVPRGGHHEGCARAARRAAAAKDAVLHRRAHPARSVPGRCNAYLEPATKEMVHATQLANVTVHAVDPNALETTNVHAGDDFIARPAPQRRPPRPGTGESRRS